MVRVELVVLLDLLLATLIVRFVANGYVIAVLAVLLSAASAFAIAGTYYSIFHVAIVTDEGVPALFAAQAIWVTGFAFLWRAMAPRMGFRVAEPRNLTDLERKGFAVSGVWTLGVLLLWIWQAANREDAEAGIYLLGIVLPIVFGWVSLGLYVWGWRPKTAASSSVAQ